MSDLIIQSTGFTFFDYLIPQFEFKKGEILHIWIPMASKPRVPFGIELKKTLSRFFLREHIIEGLKVNGDSIIAHNSSFDNFGLWRRLFPLTIESYLKKKGVFTEVVVKQVNHYLDVDLKDQIERIDALSRKILSIIAGLNMGEIVIYDYYGLGP